MQKIYLAYNLYYEVYKSKKRTIYAPSKKLKDVQRLILNFIKTKYKVELSTEKTAKIHCHKKWILKLDIRKFYESFSKEQINKTIDDIYKTVNFPETLTKKDLYNLCTVEDILPTGAVTSAYIANIAFKQTKIDENLMNFCKEENINYSRYMDDMFFSADSKSPLKKAEKLAIKLLNAEGFSINHEKTRYISDNKRQEILGLVVNNKEKTVISSDNKRKYRSIFFNYLKAVYLEYRLDINSLFKKKIGYKEITGYLAYIKACDRKFYETMCKFIKLKIKNFGIYEDDEIKKLIKMMK